jgi:predicted dienelactone hydrolase
MLKHFSRLTVLCAFIGLSGCGEPPISTHNVQVEKLASDTENTPVGMMRLLYEDSARQSWDGTKARPLTTYIWYPAAGDTEMSEIGIPPKKPVFIGGFAARGAEFASDSTQYPLIIMSHGTGGSGMQMMWIGRELARRGYIAVAIDHHGNTAAEEHMDARGFRLFWERALDVTAVLDHLSADPKLSGKIDAERIGAVGFSLGGYTVTTLAGGRIDFDLLETFCSSDAHDTTCDDQSEYPEASIEFEKLRKTDPRVEASLATYAGSFRDKRIRAVVALAPALGQAFTPESLGAIDIPMLMIGGSADTIAPVKTNATYLADQISGARMVEIDGAVHYSFLNTCNERGIKYVPVCKDPQGVDRAQIHEQAVGHIREFFDANLAVED